MTDLYDRLFPPTPDTQDKIAVHLFHAGLIDYAEGHTTRAQLITGLSLDAEATTDLDKLLVKIDGEGTMVGKHRWANNFHAAGLIAEDGLKYTTKADFVARMGL